MSTDKTILDACCGSRMFWFDKQNEDVLFMDNRELEDTLCDGRSLKVSPDVVGDFRRMDFEDNTFRMVVFDPPHLVQGGDSSWLVKKYGRLNKDTWTDDLRLGFSEAMRVLSPGGFLVFKWNEEQIKLSEVLKCTQHIPLYGNKRPGQTKTHWLIFMKEMGL